MRLGARRLGDVLAAAALALSTSSSLAQTAACPPPLPAVTAAESARPATDPSNWGTYQIGRTSLGSLFDQPED